MRYRRRRLWRLKLKVVRMMVKRKNKQMKKILKTLKNKMKINKSPVPKMAMKK